MKAPVFTGSGTALVTPFNDSGIDFEKMAKLLELQYAGGTSAVLVCGTTGEGVAMSEPEQDALTDFCCRTAAGRMKVLVGVGGNDTKKVLRRAVSAQKAGADAVLMCTPYYNKTTQAGLVSHFFHVADRLDIPVILYNVPSRTGIGIAAETYELLAAHPNINGVKEASGDISLFARTRARCGDELNVWSGNDDNTVAMMAMGAQGVISVASNLVPFAVSTICRLCQGGNFEDATALYCGYAALFDALFCEVNPIPIKAALGLMGFYAGAPRLPLVPASEKCLQQLKQAMRPLGLLAAETT